MGVGVTAYVAIAALIVGVVHCCLQEFHIQASLSALPDNDAKFGGRHGERIGMQAHAVWLCVRTGRTGVGDMADHTLYGPRPWHRYGQNLTVGQKGCHSRTERRIK